MQSHKDTSTLVPGPRGCLPSLCALGVAVVLISAAILFHERILGLVAMASLQLTLAPVLHRLFLVLEESLNHKNRYRGRWRLACILTDCGVGLKTVVSVGLSALVMYLSHTHLHHSDQWTLLFLTSALYTVFRSAGVLGPCEVEVSDICEGRKMNVAHGLAWSFYLGYLKLVLPRLENSIEEFCGSHQSSAPLWSRGSRRLLILIPINANICHKLEEEDDRIHFCENLPNQQIDRAGVRGRVYKHSVYTVMDQYVKGHVCVVEYATPLLTLYNMSQDSTAGFGEAQRRNQVLLFYRTLRDVLDRSLECRNRYTLILLNDEHVDDPHYLSKSILRHLQQQDTEEFPMYPSPGTRPPHPDTPPPHPETSPPHPDHAPHRRHAPAAPHVVQGHVGTTGGQNGYSGGVVPGQNGYGGIVNGYSGGRRYEPMSREPTLMISLDKPRSLKGPVEVSEF